MIWNELGKGICFKETSVLIPWGISVEKLRNYVDPIVANANGQNVITWKGKTLLDGIYADWSTSYFPHELAKPFKSIQILYTGDSKSFAAYREHKEYLLERLGKPLIQDEEANDQKEIKWVNGNIYIRIYLFEMHAFRYTLTIGVL